MKNLEKVKFKNKKEWLAPNIKSLGIHNTYGGVYAGDIEGTTYNGTVSP